MSTAATAVKPEKKTGPLALIGKLGLKLLSVAPKLFKALKFGKIALLGMSVAAYSLIFTWQFALVLIVMLVIHEYGHLWMMKRFKMKTKGMYLIPFLGAAAVAEEDFPSRRAEAIIAIAGPVVGMTCAVIVGIVYFITGTPFFAAVASWTALLNLFNLLPVTPLDGGRIVKSIALSIGSRIGIAVMVAGLMLAMFLAFQVQLIIFVILIPVGLLDVVYERRKMRTTKVVNSIAGILGEPEIKVQPVMTAGGMVRAFVSYVGLAVFLGVIMVAMSHEPGAAAALKALQG